jgi:hypothetical protein
VVVPASATTLIRSGLDDLVAATGTIVVGEIVDGESYWSADGTFILTVLRVSTVEVLKGRPESRELTITTMGGTVGDTTPLLWGGPVLVPGRSYVLFLNQEELPGGRALTVRDLVQGVFELKEDGGGLRAVSQANSHPLLPDKGGDFEPPGGARGLQLDLLVESVHQLAGPRANHRPEVK